MNVSSKSRSTPLAVGAVAVLVLGAAATLLSIQACGDTPGPKPPNPAGSGSSTGTTAPTTPPAPTNNTPPPPT